MRSSKNQYSSQRQREETLSLSSGAVITRCLIVVTVWEKSSVTCQLGCSGGAAAIRRRPEHLTCRVVSSMWDRANSPLCRNNRKLKLSMIMNLITESLFIFRYFGVRKGNLTTDDVMTREALMLSGRILWECPCLFWLDTILPADQVSVRDKWMNPEPRCFPRGKF